MSGHRFLAASLVLLISSTAAPSDSASSSAGYNQTAAALQELLNGTTVEADGHTPASIAIAIVADENGVLTITQTAERDQPGLFFHSTTKQTWRVRASDIDPKRIASRSEPLSVFAPVKKDKRLVQVTRTETKSRIEGGVEDADSWDEHDGFMTSFITIPAGSVETAEKAAELLKQIAKTAPKAE